ncbi:DUF551 domain-containing protein [Enterobacter hormaechei]|uniref:DUF551 domain-containing protein n=1 Tax=Enterobacter cloacae complex TaxID=354276 RepID=UPI0018EB3808|nr:DUF551 domain-containing protein [Enterobacter hormaechei]MCU2793907.1 DUF551 domain-containing protein [Enterobacter hormaechei subsp. hoffmannii]MBJ6493066.1 DUF551 domain-containing protein [Enterobacter hormaechei]MBK4240406.1 DUF551 domain-containing protein [Enterobacter hormaechei]MBK4266603.1 DUF551 domain-containing protein [Enterobacter hormaechei]MBK4477298.1 DUF551 domain-containing protein [Enterobacter hormaechei]
MSTITRELAKLFRKITNSEIDAEGNAHVVLSPADSLLINNARIALASLEAEAVGEVIEQQSGMMMDGLVISEKPTYRNIKGIHKMKMMPLGTKFYTAPPAPANAEPVAWLWSHRKHPREVTLVRPEDDEKAEAALWSGWSCQALYASPPAPISVPAAMEMDDDFDSAFEHGKAAGWNACRAAMLQSFGNSEQLNSPVIQDGWVACVERMPSAGEKVLAYRPDAPESNDPLIKMATYVGGSAHGHGFDCYCKPTHWMPLPAAPQQE